MALTLSGDNGITFPDSSTQNSAPEAAAYEFVEGGDLTGTVAELVFDVDLNSYTYDFVMSGVTPASTTSQVPLWLASSNGGSSWITSGYYYAIMTSTSSGSYGDYGSAAATYLRVTQAGTDNTEAGITGVLNISRGQLGGVMLQLSSVQERSGSATDNFNGASYLKGSTTVNAIKAYWSSGSNWSGRYSIYRRKIA